MVNQLKEKNKKSCEILEGEIVSLRKDLEKINAKMNLNIRLENGFETLDNILNSQRSPKIKIELGYK